MVTLSVTGFSPSSGPVGTSVTVNGVGFNSSSIVKFNGIAAATTVVSPDPADGDRPRGRNHRADHRHQHRRADWHRQESGPPSTSCSGESGPREAVAGASPSVTSAVDHASPTAGSSAFPPVGCSRSWRAGQSRDRARPWKPCGNSRWERRGRGPAPRSPGNVVELSRNSIRWGTSEQTQAPVAMQKVVGSSPIIRFSESPAQAGFLCRRCLSWHEARPGNGFG